MNIDNYLQNLNPTDFASPLSTYQKVSHWFHNNPSITKCTQGALYILGISLSAGAGIAFSAALIAGSATPIGAVAAAAIISGGALVIGTTWLVSTIFSYVIAPHDMSKHMFTPKKVEGGELYYEGDVPILNLTADTSFEAGKSHGYLIADVLSRLHTSLGLALHTLGGISKPSEMAELLDSVKQKIPAEYITEMEGIVDGFNTWVDETGTGTKITLDDMILYHLLPDSIHFQLPTSHTIISQIFSPLVSLACTAIVDLDEQKGPIFARNMDWPSGGLTGSHTLMIKRPGGTYEVGLPGFVGTLTGMHAGSGLSVAMNVCKNKNETLNSEVQGIPASLFNRYVLDNCKTVQEVETLLSTQRPLGPYHLTVADPNGAKAFHMYQGESNDTHTVRSPENNKPLIVTNCRYSDSGEQTCHLHYSNERDATITELFTKAQLELSPDAIDKEKLLEYSLSLPHVNNYETTHKIMMIPKTRTFKVAFNNEYAGQDPVHTVSIH